MKQYSVYAWILVSLLPACKSSSEKTKPIEEAITESVYASGTIKSAHQYDVYSSVAGLVEQVFVTEGNLVKKGDFLFKLTNTATRLNAENAEIAAAYSSQSSNREKLNEQKMNIALAQTKLQHEAIMLQRQKNLWAEQIGTRNELDTRELAWQTAESAYKTALLRYEELKKEISFQERQSVKSLQIAQTNESDYMVRSEVDGRVYSVLKEKGEMVNAQSPIAILGEADNFLIELQVDEYDITRIKAGQPVAITMDSYSGKVFEAVIQRIDPLMNERSRAFVVEAVFSKAPPALYPNLTCEANIVIREAKKVLIVPRAYVLEGDYVLLENKTKRKVKTGMKDYTKVEILSGLTKSDIILKPAL